MLPLHYEPLQEAHALALASIWTDEAVIRYTNIKTPCTPEEILARVRLLKSHPVYVVSDKTGVVGIIGCPCVDEAKVEYGVFYQFRQSAWGKGYATAATQWLLDDMRETYAGVQFLADVVTKNLASEKILRRFGFRLLAQEGSFERDGMRLSVHSYRL